MEIGKAKKSEKKVLTNGVGGGILSELSASGRAEAGGKQKVLKSRK